MCDCRRFFREWLGVFMLSVLMVAALDILVAISAWSNGILAGQSLTQVSMGMGIIFLFFVVLAIPVSLTLTSGIYLWKRLSHRAGNHEPIRNNIFI